MKSARQQIICATVGSLLAFTATARTGEKAAAPLQDQQSQNVLAAMSRSSTWGHPDEYGEFTGMQRYAAGNYKAAMKYFLIGARYADKLSQLSIGMMYLNGEGVRKDPVTAFAWIAIAAERKYPQFLATRDAVWAQLDALQREQARAKVDELYPEYGDTAAKRRMTLVLRWNHSQMTGSHLGFGADSVSSLTPEQFNGTGAAPPCGADTIDGAPITGCGNINASWRWDPKQYFAARDGAWTGKVSVGAMKQVDASGVPVKQPDRRKDIQ
ncbi:sel1 repeat family protein [Rhodanobacter ginsengisoli]|uniref:Sel1 repeat family protein n=1 Tax=Rhodanobacter ginsengisoli TaxID=418646 RepID=A0ABW0QQW0_9GAMM